LEGQNIFLGGHDFCLYHNFKTNFLDTRKFGEAQNKFGGALPPSGYGPGLYESKSASNQPWENSNASPNRCGQELLVLVVL